MNVDIITVGSIKEKYLRDAIGEYSKRIGKFCKLRIIEIPEEKLQDDSAKLVEKALDKEGEKILSHIGERCFSIALVIEGKQLSSEKLADFIKDKAVEGYSDFAFIIGSSHGLSSGVKNSVNYKLSFSPMTFPHQLMRVMLLEQVYRGFMINNNQTYHK